MPIPTWLRSSQTVEFPSADSPDHPGIGGTTASSVHTGFAIEPQEQQNWCWAAVGVSIARFYDPSLAETQCKLANRSLGRNDCCADGASDPGKCDRPWYLQNVLQLNDNLESVSAGRLSFGAVQTEIGNGSPLGSRIGWSGGGGHFAVITGWRLGESGVEYIDIADPIFLNSQIAYAEYASSYQSGGDWTHSYRTQPSGAGGSIAGFAVPDPSTLGA